MALLICGVRAAESTKVSFAPWSLFAGMGTSENQLTSNVVDCYVESNQHQWSRDAMSYALVHSSDEGRQVAGHKLCYHFTLSGLSCMHMQSHSITGVLSHRIHLSTSQWWAINGKLVSDHVRSFMELV